MCLLRNDSPHHIKSSVPVGTLLAMDDTSAAGVLARYAAGLPNDWRPQEALLTSVGAGLNRLNVNSLLTASVSVPVFKHHNQLAGALSISGPTSRFDPEEPAAGELILQAARALSQLLGATGWR